jgi:hypothetical protein
MHLKSQLIKSVLLLVVLSQFIACGYKPSSKYSRAIVGKKISTSVIISAQDPENTVLIKDAIDAAIIKIFHASLVDKKDAQTHLSLSINEPFYTPIQYDSSGYIISYRATIILGILRETKGVKKSYKTSGTYDFSVVPNAVLTDQERFDAIRFGSVKAIRSFIAEVSAEGSKKHKE